MRLKNRTITREYRIVRIPRKDGEAIEFKVSGIPLSLDRDFAAICPQPRPPMIHTVGKKAEANYDDHGFEQLFSTWQDLKKYYQIYKILENDPNVEFDVKPVDLVSMTALREGILASGLCVGDFGIILQAAMHASNITDEALEAAKGNF